MKVRFLVPWFGPWPIYLDAFLVSCEPSAGFEWVILSDNLPPAASPQNVTFHKMSLDDMNRRLRERCGLDFLLRREAIYKICDFKWCYGQMFADLLSDVSHWGICDLDVLWGRISYFLTPQILKNFDLVTTRKTRFSAHCTIFKNKPRINNYFRQVKGFEDVLRNPEECLHFDERYTTDHFKALHKSRPRKWWKRLFCRWQPKVYWERLLVNYGDDHLALRDDEYIFWDEGRALNPDGTELMYHHFHRLKGTITKCNFTYAHKPRCMKLNRFEIVGEDFQNPPISDEEYSQVLIRTAQKLIEQEDQDPDIKGI